MADVSRQSDAGKRQLAGTFPRSTMMTLRIHTGRNGSFRIDEQVEGEQEWC
jgi:hypothetical protein